MTLIGTKFSHLLLDDLRAAHDHHSSAQYAQPSYGLGFSISNDLREDNLYNSILERPASINLGGITFDRDFLRAGYFNRTSDGQELFITDELLDDLQPGQTYYIRTRHRDADGNVSAWSSIHADEPIPDDKSMLPPSWDKRIIL